MVFLGCPGFSLVFLVFLSFRLFCAFRNVHFGFLGVSRFSFGFSLFSGVGGASKSMKNLKKSSPECFGTRENRPGWAGFDGLDGEVAVELANGGPNSIRIANEWKKPFRNRGGLMFTPGPPILSYRPLHAGGLRPRRICWSNLWTQ